MRRAPCAGARLPFDERIAYAKARQTSWFDRSIGGERNEMDDGCHLGVSYAVSLRYDAQSACNADLS